MSRIAVRADRLGKRYRIGSRLVRHDTLRDAIASVATTPFRNLSRLRGLSSFNDGSDQDVIWALREVSFELAEGESLGIIGRNGAGKSTLLKILSRITRQTEGVAELHGRVGSLLEVGTGFHPDLSGRDNIYLNGSILGMHKIEIAAKFDEIVSFSGVSQYIDTPVKRYSSGMYLRLAFAVAAHLQPDILIVDEVLAVGDAEFQRRCLSKMSEIGRQGRTVLFVSHNMNAIQGLCEKVMLLEGGGIAMSGAPREVVNEYLQKTFPAEVEQSWPDPGSAPGNDLVRLHSARIRPADGSPQDSITIETDLVLEIEYWNLVQGARIELFVAIRTLEGTTAFGTGSGGEPGWGNREYPAGLYRKECHIPGRLLNNGEYRVELLVIRDDTDVILKQEDLAVFSVRNVVTPGVGWHGAWPGVVRPALRWKTRWISESSETS
jgi:lipopolysaccharide transport system ATP-binding protein